MGITKTELINNEEYFESLSKSGVLFYGAGAKGIQALELLAQFNIKPQAFIESDPGRWNTKCLGIEIISLEEAKRFFAGHTIFITTAYDAATEIRPKLVEWKGEVRILTSPFKTENTLLDYGDLIQNADIIEDEYSLLSDEKSKILFIDMLNWKLTGDSSLVARNKEDDTRLWGFQSQLLNYSCVKTYLDIGAYNGDTIVRFMIASQKKCRIVAVEPDENAMNEMRGHMSRLRLDDNIDYVLKGVSDKRGELTFHQMSERVYESSNFMNDIKDIVPFAISEEKIVDKSVPVDTLDNICRELDIIDGSTLVKLDTQGMEYQAINGGGGTDEIW